MTLAARAKALETEVARLVASPAAALIPAQVRGLLGMQSEFLVVLAERLEALERKNDGNSDRAG